jgi:putative heme transporter
VTTPTEGHIGARDESHHDGHPAWHLPPALDDDHEPVDPAEAVGYELHRKSLSRKLVEAAVSITALVVLFALVIPSVAGSTYHEVAHQLRKLSIAEITWLGGVWLVGLAAYAGVLTSALPGLRRSQGMVLNTATSAVSNVVPFGGAVGVGATYGMCRSWGFDVADTTLGILVSGIWNVFLKFGLPVLALVLLVSSGEGERQLLGLTIFGLAALVLSVVLLTLVLRNDRLAGLIGRILQRIMTGALHVVRRTPSVDVEHAVLDFRHRSRGLIAARWRGLTLWMLAYSLLQFLLQLMCLRMLGEHSLTTIEIFAAFAFGRLLSTIPFTPGGIGFSDATALGALVAFGGNHEVCFAGVLLFTGITYLLEIPVGGISWVIWSRMSSWRKPVAHPAPAGPLVTDG